jgi:transcriptional regulator with XRE-family HTH domain
MSNKDVSEDRIMKTLAERLKYALARRGMRQTTLARAIGVPSQTIQQLTSKGKRTVFAVEIARELNISPDWLTDGIGTMEVKTKSKLQTKIEELNDDDRHIITSLVDKLSNYTILQKIKALTEHDRTVILRLIEGFTQARNKN